MGNKCSFACKLFLYKYLQKQIPIQTYTLWTIYDLDSRSRRSMYIYSRTSLIRTPTDGKICSPYPEFVLTEVISIEKPL